MTEGVLVLYSFDNFHFKPSVHGRYIKVFPLSIQLGLEQSQ